MIPPFNDVGCLPPGLHPAPFDEIETRFGRQSEIRAVQMQSVRWMIDLATRAGAERIVLNGSFVTDIMEPNDVDCVLLFAHGKRKDRKAFRELKRGLPFLDVSVVNQRDFDSLVGKFFAADRKGLLKGMIEVVLWT
jgi:hypothetical protein